LALIFSNKEVFQVEEGEGFQEERGVPNTLGHLILVLEVCRAFSLVLEGF